MKTLFKMLCIGALATLCSISCKKQGNDQEIKNTVLEQSEDFRNYVAVDLLSRVRVSLLMAKQIKGLDHVSLKKELSIASETSIPTIFHDYNMDYSIFQKHEISRVIRRARIIEKLLPSVDKLSNDQMDNRINDAYSKVANELLELARAKFERQLLNTPKSGITLKESNSSGTPMSPTLKKTVNMIDESVEDYYLLSDFETSFSTDIVVGDIAIELDKTNTDGLTIGETWNCFKSAMGFGGLGMGGVASWARLSAGMQIQELIAFATKWAMKHIGWIGAALAVADFGVCIYDSI